MFWYAWYVIVIFSHIMLYFAYYAYCYMQNITNMKPCTIFLHIMCHIFHTSIDLHIMVYCFAYLAYQFTYFAYILSYFAYCNITNMQNMKPCTIICHIMLHIYVKLYVTLNSICRICQIICRKICQNMQNAWRVYISHIRHIRHIYALPTLLMGLVTWTLNLKSESQAQTPKNFTPIRPRRMSQTLTSQMQNRLLDIANCR